MKSSHVSISAFLIVLALPCGICGSTPCIRSLAMDSDCVIWGDVAAEHRLARGSVHEVRVLSVLHGEAQAGTILVFTLPASVADAPRIEEGEKAVLGLRWPGGAAGRDIAAAAGFQDGAAPPLGILAAQGKLETADSALVQDIALWIRAARARGADPGAREALLALIDHRHPALRRAAIDTLAEAPGILDAGEEERARRSFEREASLRGDPDCLASWVNLAGMRRLPEAGAVLRLLLHSSHERLIAPAAEALARAGSPADLAALIEDGWRSGKGRRRGVLLALGRFRSDEALPLLRSVVLAGDPDEAAAAARAAAGLAAPAAGRLLQEIATAGLDARHSPPLAATFLDSLNRSASPPRRHPPGP